MEHDLKKRIENLEAIGLRQAKDINNLKLANEVLTNLVIVLQAVMKKYLIGGGL